MIMLRPLPSQHDPPLSLTRTVLDYPGPYHHRQNHPDSKYVYGSADLCFDCTRGACTAVSLISRFTHGSLIMYLQIALVCSLVYEIHSLAVCMCMTI